MKFDLLTTVEYGGCSAKIPATILDKVLQSLPRITDDNILVDIDTHDDAGVYRISDDLALIFTTDFFPPICSDPFEFGQIAAANSLSDVYAMGGEPFLALNIAMFPASTIPIEVYREILEGAADTAKKASTIIIGGHTIDDYPPKFGLAVIGKVHPKRIITNSGLKPKQILVLTKPVGMGAIVAGKRLGIVNEEDYRETIGWMKLLNKDAAKIMQKYSISGATDITGFGLIGHALKMAKASNVNLVVNSKKVPYLNGAYDLIDNGCIPGAAFRNLEYTEKSIIIDGCSYNHKMLLMDAQTSGGILMGVMPNDVDSILNALKSKGYIFAQVVGEVEDGSGVVKIT